MVYMLRSFSRLNLPIRGWKLEVDFGEGQKVGQEVWEVNPENYHQSLASRTFFRGLQNKKRKTAQRDWIYSRKRTDGSPE